MGRTFLRAALAVLALRRLRTLPLIAFNEEGCLFLSERSPALPIDGTDTTIAVDETGIRPVHLNRARKAGF